MRSVGWVPAGSVAAIALIALAAPILPLPDPVKIDVAHRLAGWSAAHPLGLDEYGRDELSRLIWGGASPWGSPRARPGSPVFSACCWA